MNEGPNGSWVSYGVLGRPKHCRAYNTPQAFTARGRYVHVKAIKVIVSIGVNLVLK